ncbi:MAG: Nif3-like dinuclear metal center hexameric protein [Treponema sp.]|uniref:Nif3-like dinuclear metal center hexameric protein n=1 Tax=Treponema sp. TaxID=166 RepID=UPI001B675907|nr:Nif3-like dinuclear metal center hexameric protein [Treponema sp.]MBP5402543.1 Nif3-like dinuclear metal center hexameric protein [Treponema sp.]MBR5933872.1 Nif3-like dinuclear metal center hexameric protein [Treponema sp.]
MTLKQLDKYFNSFLKKENYSRDVSLNGIQIENSAPDLKEIKKVAFAVDASEETALKAKKCGADVLFCHHGLFWGQCETITGNVYKRINAFLKNDIALIAYHIPLDANKPYGNNWGLAARAGLTKVKTFGEWRSMEIGVYGQLRTKLTIDKLAEKILLPGEKPVTVLNFGKKDIKTVGIISGGAGEDVTSAVELGLDAYVTGEFSHELYHYVKENCINVIAGGHYQTETVGVKLVMKKLAKDKKIDVEFIDVPTGM